jgi:nitrite reductase (NO-forming)
VTAHHLTARLWLAGALLAVFLPAGIRLGWWLPLHLALLGAASQLIAGGQIMFSGTLGMAPPARRVHVTGSLALLNLGAAAIAVGRVSGVLGVVILGATTFLAGTAWSGLVADSRWRRGLGRRFRVTRTYYGLAGASIVIGGTAGAILASGVLSGTSQATHRLMHMAFNLFGWAGMTIVGTAITLLPAVLRTRAVYERSLAWAPWTMFGGLLVLATGLSLNLVLLAAAGGVLLVAGLAPFVRVAARIATGKRRFPVPVAAWHLMAAIGWLALVALAQIGLLVTGNLGAVSDLWLVGLAGGTVVQAILGAWSFLLPMDRQVGGGVRRLHLVAFEIGGRLQVAAYNLGLVLLVLSLRGAGFSGSRQLAISLVWAAVAWALFKSFAFGRLAKLPRVARRSESWWEPKR